jgi:hypothetical protein
VSAWPATLSSGGVRLIDQDLFYQLAKYYRSVDMYLIPVDAPDPFAEDEIFGRDRSDASQFYDSAELRPRFRQYLARRKAILQGAQEALDEGRSILEELRARAAR